MKVLLVNGSPHKEGCTYTALTVIEKELQAAGVETEIYWVGAQPISGCLGCGGCVRNGGKCVIDDSLNPFLEKAREADGFIFGSPVHYAAASGALTSFMDRAFYGKAGIFQFKPAAAIVSCRRGGATAAFDQLNKYFTISSMPVVSSKYWNGVHGTCPAEVLQDAEGLQVMRELGRNMAWLIKCIEAGRAAGIEAPEKETPIKTNFIR
ncbi:MAG: flavodoxin family protein [Bacteroidales bacterium]|nr:flavodoxin family protein [Bacteroidales bacterium]